MKEYYFLNSRFTEDLLVIVEFCCHGNLQQFLLARRHTFISQVDPNTGAYDPNMRLSVKRGHLNLSEDTGK
jgi:hypothetical protein